MADESVASSSSFYEPSIEYSDEKTHMVYQHVKANLQDIQKLANDINGHMKSLKRNMLVTVKLLDILNTHENDNKKH